MAQTDRLWRLGELDGALKRRIFQRSKCNRPTGRFDGRYAVLPFFPGETAQHIERSGRKIESPSLPLPSLAAFKAHTAGSAQRDASHDPERWQIAMPADGGPMRIARPRNASREGGNSDVGLVSAEPER
jgi:hypothetical protein